MSLNSLFINSFSTKGNENSRVKITIIDIAKHTKSIKDLNILELKMNEKSLKEKTRKRIVRLASSKPRCVRENIKRNKRSLMKTAELYFLIVFSE